MSFFEEACAGEQRLTMVIVSDVHKRLDRVRQLLDWLARDEDEGGCRVPVADVLLCAGDIAHRSVPADGAAAATAADTETAADMSAVLMALENVCARLVYVPGNHDAPCAFAVPPPALTVHACSAHGRVVRVLPGLVVVGLGGSAPAASAGQPVRWSAYPYADDAALGAALACALNPPGTEQPEEEEEIKEQERSSSAAAATEATTTTKTTTRKKETMESTINVSLEMVPHAVEREEERLDAARDFVVLLTHAGPDVSPTSVDYTGAAGAPVAAGSAAVARALAAGAPVFGLAVHGHTHAGRGAATLAHGTLVVNPGALCDGHFAVCTLVRRAAAPRWAVETLVLHALPPLPAAAQLRL